MLWIMLTVTLPWSDAPPPLFLTMSHDRDDVTSRLSTNDVIGDWDHDVLLSHCTQHTKYTVNSHFTYHHRFLTSIESLKRSGNYDTCLQESTVSTQFYLPQTRAISAYTRPIVDRWSILFDPRPDPTNQTTKNFDSTCNHGLRLWLLQRQNIPPFRQYSLRLFTEGWPGWFDLVGWLAWSLIQVLNIV